MSADLFLRARYGQFKSRYHMTVIMPSFDDRLETALSDCNERVNQLDEKGGTEEEYLDALLNRGSVLSMMEYYTSAVSDFDDAVDIIRNMAENGKEVDAGRYVKALVSRGELYSLDSLDMMAEDYSLAATRISELNENSRYYDRKRIVTMCLDCSEDLVDAGYLDAVSPFIDKAYELLVGHDDKWSRNRYLDMLNISGRAMSDAGVFDKAVEYYSDAIDAGNELRIKEELEDRTALVFSYISRGDIAQEKGILDLYFEDRDAAIELLEELLSLNKMENTELLISLHQDVANTYLTQNKMKEAEEHLLKEVVLNMDGVREYLKEFVNLDKY